MYLEKEVADAAILGLNEMRESSLESKLEVLRYLDFARCRLSIAGMNGKKLDLKNSTIATSYPKILKEYLSANNIKANIVEISGCVEIAPKIGITDYICDPRFNRRNLEGEMVFRSCYQFSLVKPY